jgi:EAL domain-containing protein (putative c-di-GMP-specific phosphodiesterase class I)
MGMKTVAEHVESEDALHALQRIGIDYAQGFDIDPPVPFKWAPLQIIKAS